jgi:hypothetical protein
MRPLQGIGDLPGSLANHHKLAFHGVAAHSLRGEAGELDALGELPDLVGGLSHVPWKGKIPFFRTHR